MEWNPLNWGKADINQADYQLGDLDYMRHVAQNGIQGAHRAAPTSQAAQAQGSQLNGAMQGQSRGMQMGLAQQLQGIASGQRQGAGELATQRQVSQGMAGQQAMARMARGANQAGGAGIGAARNMAAMSVGGAGQAQQAALQDQSNAMGQLGQVSGQMRGQDMDLAGQNAQLQQQMALANAGFQQQTNMANQQANLQNRGQNDAAALAYLQQLYGANMGQAGLQGAFNQANMDNKGMFPDLLQAGGTIGAAAACDERVKTDVTNAAADVDAFLSKLEPVAFDYVDTAKHGAGRRVGVMAQDVEASKAGAGIVDEVDGIKHIDITKSVPLILAALARIDERLKALEAR